MSGHRPEVGRTVGVAAWAAGDTFCAIVCTNGHPKRTLDRVRWVQAEDRGELYTAAFRLDDPAVRDPGTSAEEDPTSYETRWRLRCPTCGLDVVLNRRRLDQLARWARDTSARRIELGRLAASVGG
jgi:hypothetical protein